MPSDAAYTTSNIEDYVGRVFGPGKPVTLGQDKIQLFADATGDQQWIHTDVERAKAESPFGGPIAHGFLTLSLIASAQLELGVFPSDASGVMNYGLDKVRFLAPVKAGAQVTVTSKLTEIERQDKGRIVFKVSSQVQEVGAEKPAVIADTIAMVFR